jgi:hypothetical protein
MPPVVTARERGTGQVTHSVRVKGCMCAHSCIRVSMCALACVGCVHIVCTVMHMACVHVRLCEWHTCVCLCISVGRIAS